MICDVKAEDVMFIDIETVPQKEDYGKLDAPMQMLWDKKSRYFRNEDQTGADVYERAGIYAEFGKIICISAGIIKETNPFSLRLKSFFGDDERSVLEDFTAMLAKFMRTRPDALLCGHNAKEFDFPYMARRMIINGLPVAPLLNNAGKKPWEVRLLDTMELWKFGDYKSFTSLELLTTILNIPTPKDDIDGSMVARVYREENGINRIVKYCEKDVIAVAQVFLRFMNLGAINPDRIESVTQI
jgi:DNA polymerase elongation subunit (family B)